MRLKNVQIGLLLLLGMLSLSFTSGGTGDIKELYNEIETTTVKPKFPVFAEALEGYSKLKEKGLIENSQVLTIIDYSISANQKRLWVIDLENKKVLYHTLVAHGMNTGEEYAQYFSNKPNSHKSSLGFYITGSTYYGKHGLSLHLKGVEEGFNDNAQERAIVMHGADYVSKDFIQKYGRLGRSFGCPALPMQKSEEVIPLLAHKACLFIYYPDPDYLNSSKLINDHAT